MPWIALYQRSALAYCSSGFAEAVEVAALAPALIWAAAELREACSVASVVLAAIVESLAATWVRFWLNCCSDIPFMT